MLKQLTHVQVWVHDQDEALAFYTETLGMELREDVTVPELGNFRWLSVGIPFQDVSITLMTIPGPPVFDEETRPDPQAARQGCERRALLRDGRHAEGLRGAEESRRGVHPGADRAAVRHRRRLPRRLRNHYRMIQSRS